eukprot:4508172-Prymnesium_polylepis.1
MIAAAIIGVLGAVSRPPRAAGARVDFGRSAHAASFGRREAIAALLATPALMAALPAMAKPAALSAQRFTGDYEDKLHPLCERRISVDRDTDSQGRFLAHLSGTDVGPVGIGDKVKLSCSEENIERYKLREWSFDARIDATGNQIDAG